MFCFRNSNHTNPSDVVAIGLDDESYYDKSNTTMHISKLTQFQEFIGTCKQSTGMLNLKMLPNLAVNWMENSLPGDEVKIDGDKTRKSTQ